MFLVTRALIVDGKKYNTNEHLHDNKLHIIRVGKCTDFFSWTGRISSLAQMYHTGVSLIKKYDIELIHAHTYFPLLV